MCTFCDDIYPERDATDIVFGRGKYINIAQGGSFITPDDFITVDEGGEFDIVTNPGDPYELGLVRDIKFCPYCRRILKDIDNVKSPCATCGVSHKPSCCGCKEYFEWREKSNGKNNDGLL